MDPFIDPGALDRAHPYFARKMENLRLADAAHATRGPVDGALPSKLVLQTTDTCNLRCVMCHLPADRKHAQMSRDLFERVAEQLFPTLIELHPSNVGEPLTWPHFQVLCETMARDGVLLDLTTNGTLLADDRLEWIAPIVRDVKFSVDGATAATFERIRAGASFARVCRNVRATVLRLALVAVRRPTVALQMTLMRSNVGELSDLVRLAADLGVSGVRAYHLFSPTRELDHESLAGEPDAWWPAAQEAIELGEALGLHVQFAEPRSSNDGVYALSPTVCHLPWHETWIDSDGSVLVCHSHGGDVAGSVNAEEFQSIWNGRLYSGIRAGWTRGEPGWHCRGCGMGWQKSREHDPVPYDPESFLSPEGRAALGTAASPIRWSGRMRPFDLHGRRPHDL